METSPFTFEGQWLRRGVGLEEDSRSDEEELLGLDDGERVVSDLLRLRAILIEPFPSTK